MVLASFGIVLRVALVVEEGLANRAEDLAFEALWAGVRDPVVNQIVCGYVAVHETINTLKTAKRYRSGRARPKARHDDHYNQSNLKVRRARTTNSPREPRDASSRALRGALTPPLSLWCHLSYVV